ncbi:MAG: PRC-barrel domain-containing protein, partial [Thermoplasmatales archaeon]|nr:PRC-barrel domain-containing protein [Thermoplasmatales archaeon]
MSVFKNNEKFSSEAKNRKKNSKSLKEKPKNIKKKKIGFGRKHKEISRESVTTKNEEITTTEEGDVQATDSQTQLEGSIESKKNFENEKDFLEEMISEEKIIPEETVKSEKREEWSKSKRKTLIKKDMKGKPVFLEDTGEKIGTVFDAIYDGEGNLVGYKIKDNKSESILSFPLDQFGEDKGGLIFVPSWYTKGVKTIEKLEFKDRISPELTWLLKDRTITEEELYNIFVKHDDIIANYMEESVALRELLSSRLKILERERLTLKEDLMDL